MLLNVRDITKHKVLTSLMFLVFVAFSIFGSSETFDMSSMVTFKVIGLSFVLATS